MRLLTPRDVGLHLADYDRLPTSPYEPDGWVAHWPGEDRQFAGTFQETCERLQAYERYHVQQKGYAALAYDYAADMAGRAIRIRGTGRSAATSGDYDRDGIPNNDETDAVLLLIGPGQRPSAAMRQTWHALIGTLGGRRRYVIGHNEASGPRACPGEPVMTDLVIPYREGTDVSKSRLAGPDRYATAVLINERRFPGDWPHVYLFRSGSPDGEVAPVLDAPVLPVERDTLPGAVAAALSRHGCLQVEALGGPGSVSDAVLEAARQACTG